MNEITFYADNVVHIVVRVPPTMALLSSGDDRRKR